MLQIGDQAPDFELLSQDDKPIRLSDYRGRKVILFAFPQADTMGCNMQACGFRDEFPHIRSANAVVLGVSTDNTTTLQRWKQNKHFPYDLLSDPDHQMLEAWDAWGIPKLGLLRSPRTKRSYWVIDEAGTIIDMEINVGPKESVRKALMAVGEASH